ncbi:hypothetical protein PMAYCL1PPCAC_06101, partial [Pristionchus mayeri]
SPPVEIAGIPWCINLCKADECLSTFIYRKGGDYTVHSLKANFEITVLNHDDNAKNECRKAFGRIFDKKTKYQGFGCFM